MRLFITFFLLCIALGIGFAVYIRVAPSDPDVWHVDPVTTPDPTRPSFSRVDRVVPLAPAEAAGTITERARIEGATLLAGDLTGGDLTGDGGHATWVARTALMRFPDYVSVRLVPEGEGTRIIALSRSRFGYSDQGVNRARLGRWLPG